jgi:hypothetical protein
MKRDQLADLVKANDLEAIRAAIAAGEVIRNGATLMTKADREQIDRLSEQAAYWNRIQHVRKIFLNS